jgi:hypothetical protein
MGNLFDRKHKGDADVSAASQTERSISNKVNLVRISLPNYFLQFILAARKPKVNSNLQSNIS